MVTASTEVTLMIPCPLLWPQILDQPYTVTPSRPFGLTVVQVDLTGIAFISSVVVDAPVYVHPASEGVGFL
jgi:hypothetical protein